MNKSELTELVFDAVNSMNVMLDHNEPAKTSDNFEDDLCFDSLDTTELTYDLVDRFQGQGMLIQYEDIEQFWFNYGDKTVQQLIDYLADWLRIEN